MYVDEDGCWGEDVVIESDSLDLMEEIWFFEILKWRN